MEMEVVAASDLMLTQAEMDAFLELLYREDEETLREELKDFPAKKDVKKEATEAKEEQTKTKKRILMNDTKEVLIGMLNSHSILWGNSPSSITKGREDKEFSLLFNTARDGPLLRESIALLNLLDQEPAESGEEHSLVNQLIGKLALNKERSPVLTFGRKNWMEAVMTQCCHHGTADVYKRFLQISLNMGLVHEIHLKHVKKILNIYKNSPDKYQNRPASKKRKARSSDTERESPPITRSKTNECKEEVEFKLQTNMYEFLEVK